MTTYFTKTNIDANPKYFHFFVSQFAHFKKML